jgi:UDP-glucuronate decarboxylase
MTEQNKIIAADLAKIHSASLPWERLFGKTVLIAGANGFLPAYMVKTILYINELDKGLPIKVIALIRNQSKAEERFAAYLNRSDLQFFVSDISKPLHVDEQVDFIIHAASQASPKFYASDPVGTLSANTIGTFNLLQFAKEKQVEKFLYFSSSEVYGSVASNDSISETNYGVVDPLSVRSCYAESKRMGENMCVSFCEQYQIPVSIVRPFHTYGPGLSLDDGRVFADFVACIVNGKNIEMNSDGSAVRSFCYLADATVGFFTVLLLGAEKHAYNIGNPKASVSIKQLAESLAGLYPEKGIKTVFKEKSDGYLPSAFLKLTPNISKADELGWDPETLIEEGFKRTIESFT